MEPLDIEAQNLGLSRIASGIQGLRDRIGPHGPLNGRYPTHRVNRGALYARHGGNRPFRLGGTASAGHLRDREDQRRRHCLPHMGAGPEPGQAPGPGPRSYAAVTDWPQPRMAYGAGMDLAFSPTIEPLGLHALLIRLAGTFSEAANAHARQLREAVEDAEIPGVLETAPTLVGVLVRLGPRADPAPIAEQLEGLIQSCAVSEPTPPARRWQVPMAVTQDCAPGLAEAAHTLGLTDEQLVHALTADDVTVLSLGFAPGQPYLGLFPPEVNLPRRANLAPVPWGGVAIAVRQAVLFTNDSPTGWYQVGLSAFRVFQPDTSNPFPLAPGDAVRFERADAAEIASLRAGGGAGARMDPL